VCASRVFEGMTVDNHPVDARLGAVRRCECWWEYLSAFYGVPRRELGAKLEELKRDRQKRKRAA
jgi:hypothetical protein